MAVHDHEVVKKGIRICYGVGLLLMISAVSLSVCSIVPAYKEEATT